MSEVDMAAVLRRLHRSDDLSRLAEVIPYMRFLGLQVEVGEAALVVTMPSADHLIGNPVLPALHGGTVGALLESTAIFQLLWEVEQQAVPKIISITVDYLRSGRVMDTRASAIITKHGRRVANVRVTAWQDDADRPIAAGHAHFLLKNA